MRFRSISRGVAHWKPAACCSEVAATRTRSAMVRPPDSSEIICTGMPAKSSRKRLHWASCACAPVAASASTTMRSAAAGRGRRGIPRRISEAEAKINSAASTMAPPAASRR